MKARVFVTLKNGVLDPQGKAIGHALNGLGFPQVGEVRQGKLIDFKLEFGRIWIDDDMHIVLADEISPDNCRLWDLKTNEKLDKDRFRQDLGGVEEAYQEVARRLGLLQAEDESAVLDFDKHRKKRGR